LSSKSFYRGGLALAINKLFIFGADDIVVINNNLKNRGFAFAIFKLLTFLASYDLL
jgi:hypothetical protein